MQHPNPRHIQNYSEASSLQPHWGYADRVIPCTNDVGSCQYLDVVYHSHDLGMLYCGIVWATIIGILLFWCIHTGVARRSSGHPTFIQQGDSIEHHVGTLERVRRTITTYRRQFLLPEFAQTLFGRTTRLQILVLVVLTGYLAVFTFVGFAYRTWITPVKKMPGLHSTRTSLGPWSDRVGVLAYALTPLSVLLSSRESILSIITGLPYQSFNFLHRWLGYIIVLQSAFHTIGWCVIEIRLYQPQPKVGREWISQLYMIWGVIAMFLLSALFVLSTPWAIRRTGYEFFRKSHYVLAMLYIGACWAHWSKLECYLIPALVVWLVDRGVRLARTAVMHNKHTEAGSKMQFSCTDAKVTLFPDNVNGDVVRLDLQQSQDPWHIGQHFYLTFPRSSIWQSHPFTPLNLPVVKDGVVQHSYVFRAKTGETAKIARIASNASLSPTSTGQTSLKIPVILSGPYGVSELDGISSTTNILCVAGGTGITYVLPIVLAQLASCLCSSTRKIKLIWAVRQRRDICWALSELEKISSFAKKVDLQIVIFVTREPMTTTIGGQKPTHNKETSVAMKIVHSFLSSSLTSTTSAMATAVQELCTEKDGMGDDQSSTDHSMMPFSSTEPTDNPISWPREGRPNLRNVLMDFLARTVQDSTVVYASGPGEMITDLRSVVAGANNGAKVWKGDMRHCVELRTDDRLEW